MIDSGSSGREAGGRSAASRPIGRIRRLAPLAIIAWAVAGTVNTATPQTPPAAQPAVEPEEEYGEFLARPHELAPVAVNDIAKSIRMTATAMTLGKTVFEKACASCHGADLKGLPDQHTPDLTDADWRFSGDDLPSGGAIKYPSDVEWTVLYGIRSGHPNTRGEEADMLAYNPQYRTADDTKEFGPGEFLNAAEIADVVEYVLQISGQPHDGAKAARGDGLFHDGSKGNCTDCHAEDATGNDALGSTNLTRKELYLWGTDRASISESITRGRRGVMPAFEGVLKPEELKAVSIYVLNRARK